MAEVVVDTKAIEELADDFQRGKRSLIGRLAERGYQLLRSEIKSTAYVTGNLMQGVAAPEIDYEDLEALLTVSASSAKGGSQTGKLIGADGKEKKTVTLKPSPRFNYAAAVARGRPAIRPKTAKVLIIPVPSAPSGESYLLVGGQVYIMRRSAKATKPNPFDERAAKRLDGEAQRIADAVLAKFV